MCTPSLCACWLLFELNPSKIDRQTLTTQEINATRPQAEVVLPACSTLYQTNT